ncbi:MAG: aminoacyl-tRNA hydrolase [Spirochaetia bacterium]
MTLVIGLGNPGPEYEHTRHNAGFDVIDSISQKLEIKMKKPLFRKYLRGRGILSGEKVELVKPLTYMNRSGMIIPRVTKGLKGLFPDHFIIITDNLDLPPGKIRVKRGASTAGHNGLASVKLILGDTPYLRVFVGIGHPGSKEDVVPYVLSKPEGKEAENMSTAIEAAADTVIKLISSDPEAVMNESNR